MDSDDFDDSEASQQDESPDKKIGKGDVYDQYMKKHGLADDGKL